MAVGGRLQVVSRLRQNRDGNGLMKVTMLLADAAQSVGGKLYILGGGWSVAGPGPVTMAIALKVEVPWDQTNRQHQVRIDLVTEDGHPVTIPHNPGEEPQPVEFEAGFEVGRPPGLRAGTPLDTAFAINVHGLPIPPDGRYAWRVHINGETRTEWQCAFTMRPGQGA